MYSANSVHFSTEFEFTSVPMNIILAEQVCVINVEWQKSRLALPVGTLSKEQSSLAFHCHKNQQDLTNYFQISLSQREVPLILFSSSQQSLHHIKIGLLLHKENKAFQTP